MPGPLSLAARAARAACSRRPSCCCSPRPGTASADTFTDVYKDFAKDGAVEPCAFTAKQLRSARSQVTPDLEQYAPDFPAALDLAIEARANGACKKKNAGGPHPRKRRLLPPHRRRVSAPEATAGRPRCARQPHLPLPRPRRPRSNARTETPQPVPVPAAAPGRRRRRRPPGSPDRADRGPVRRPARGGRRSGTLAALLLLTSLVWLTLRALAWQPTWFPRARHAFHEAGWRASGTWQDFTDWVRLGR